MKRKTILLLGVAFSLILCAIVVSASSEDSLFYATGKTLKDYYNNIASMSDNEGESNIAAIYHNKTISWAVIEQNRNARMLFTEEGTEQWTDREVINAIVEGMIMVEEAERIGVAATQEEIDSMVEGTKLNYEIPEVKELLDDYCAGAEISIEYYFELLEQHAPAIISKQKLRNEIGRRYCEEHGLEFTNVNPPQEMMDAIDIYIDDLYETYKGDIIYYIDD